MNPLAPAAMAAGVFPDVPENYWAAKAIGQLKTLGVINGTEGANGELEFQPNGTVTRAEFAKMLVDGAKLPLTGGATPFADVGGHWAAKYIAAATNAGVIKGYDGGVYKPENRITREEMAVILERVLRRGGIEDQTHSSAPFADDAQISEWARVDVYRGQQQKLFNIENGRFEPGRQATRAEAAYMLYNSLNVLAGPQGANSEAMGVKQVAAVQGDHLAVWDGKQWQSQFWRGVNLGATTPGHYPGELSPTKQDYLRWFAQMKEMHVDLVRVYTILPPYFYEALEEFNAGRQEPLWLMQGIWSPEEEMIGEDEKGRDAYDPLITDTFTREIQDIVKVVHGDITLPSRSGHASGTYRTDVSPYLLGWVVGTEWYPQAVQLTDRNHAGMPKYEGVYFHAKDGATPFESWLAKMLDTAATEEMKYGWQHPVSFTNWVSADPLKHPNEPFPEEDMVSVDPMHVGATEKWVSGYFASYHVYPYYPDGLRFDQKLQTAADPYAAYLKELRAHHQGLPLMVAEFGIPSSRGLAHRGPLERNQGMHTEQEQGKIVADLFQNIWQEGFDGGFVFSWQDEWFKFTWNTMSMQLPRDRRAMWFNRLTNEANFGLIAVEPGKSERDVILLDGKADEWAGRAEAKSSEYPGFSLSVAHDEGYLYLLAKKKEGAWDLAKEPLNFGFDTLDGGSAKADMTGAAFAQPIEFLMQIKGEQDAHLYVNSAYDQHTWKYRKQLKTPADYAKAEAGTFLPWKLALSHEMYLPETKETVPFEEVEIGALHFGITDPSNAAFNSLADWYAKGNVLEIRIPWMMLGYTDPSTHQVWNYPYQADKFENVTSPALIIEPFLGTTTGTPLSYTWKQWDLPTYHERKKASYQILSDVYKSHKELKNK
ncbi:MAG: S-layer homology domain-containing protein [Tumebacillaceae bacterium]